MFNFLKTVKLFSKLVVPFYIPANSVWDILLLHILISNVMVTFFFFLKELLYYFFYFYLFIYSFIFVCVGSSFLCEGFLQLRQAGTTLHRGARASHYRGLSCCGAQAPDTQAQ